MEKAAIPKYKIIPVYRYEVDIVDEFNHLVGKALKEAASWKWGLYLKGDELSFLMTVKRKKNILPSFLRKVQEMTNPAIDFVKRQSGIC